VLGHEAAGRVVEVGSQVSQVAVGDRVVTSFIPACGRCFWCHHGQSNLCSRAFDVADTPRVRVGETTAAAFLGIGSFAEVMTVDEASTVPVRTDLPDEQLALLGCGVTTGVCAVLETARVRAGEAVAVVGCGGVGQAVIQGAAIAGAARIIAIDPVAFKRDAALANGATDVIDPSARTAQPAIAELTDGRGADYVFEATGSTKVARDAFELVRRGGALVILGMPRFDAELTLPANPLFATGRRVLASKFGDAQVRRDFQRLIDLTETGRLDLKNMVSRRVSLPEINEAVRAMREGKVIRSVIV
jgi:S-(hydroxymethyl)glutathione dehydrogenase/alcohol dehydrogenase